MRARFLLLCAVSLVVTAFGQQVAGTNYQYTVDLTNVVDDKVFVELTVPQVKQDEIIFYFPKMIPGTYEIEDYGRFVSAIKATDKRGTALPVEKTDTNTWTIRNARKLLKISYWIEDSFDTKLEGPEIFPPAGTNIEANKNFVINPSGFFGYIKGLKEIPFTVNVIRSEKFYGSTGLIPLKAGEPVSKINLEKGEKTTGKLLDIYKTNTYDELVDSPIMYAQPDTAIVRVGNTEVLIGSYSPNGVISAKEVANSVKEVLMAQKEYLGGDLPVNKYAFIFYFSDQPGFNFGALEHNYSSMYYMPEQSIEVLYQELRDVAAHEFFHIVTPLSIHSEEIGSFDFNEPKMSQHLWLYEGLTEYFAGNVQVKYGLISPERYLGMIREKMLYADEFDNNLSFTELSRHVFDKYHEQYNNVYMKGALIGMCLDIKLRNLSNGKYGMQNLVADLAKKYGKNVSFKDEELFDEITSLTYPEIGVFLKRYVAGSEPLPLQEIFALVGIEYKEEMEVTELNLGLEDDAIEVTQLDGKPMIAVSHPDVLNEQGQALEFKTGDILIKINGDPIPPLGPEIVPFIQKQNGNLVAGEKLTYTVLRKNEAGKLIEKVLSAEIIEISHNLRHVLQFMTDPSVSQLTTRKAWLTPEEEE